MKPLRTALDRGQLSIRGVDRTLRVAWTLADLAGRISPGLDEVGTALSFRRVGGAMTDQSCRVGYLSRVVEPPCPELAALVARVGPSKPPTA